MSKSTINRITFQSEFLNGKVLSSLVYVPEIDDQLAPLPVLYFLHGRSGDENILTEAGIDTMADRLVREGRIKPMIIVCPCIENSRGINSASKESEQLVLLQKGFNAGRYDDYFIREVIPMIDASFETLNDRKGRFVGGASAGGYAALHYAFRHPDLFSKVGGHMPAVDLKLEEEDRSFFGDEQTWVKYDPISIARNFQTPPDLKVFLDAGDQDEGQFYKGCAVLNELLMQKGITVQNHVFPGHHNLEYIRANMETYLLFYGAL